MKFKHPYDRVLALTEKESMKVELTLGDDLKTVNGRLLKTVERADNAWKSYQDYLTGADKKFRDMMQSRKQLDSDLTSAEQLQKRTIKVMNEIGVPVSKLPIYDGFVQNIKTSNEIMNTIDSFKDPSTFQ